MYTCLDNILCYSTFSSPAGLFGIEESIGTIIGVVAAGIGGVVVLIIVLTPQLRKCILCMRQGSRQGEEHNPKSGIPC